MRRLFSVASIFVFFALAVLALRLAPGGAQALQTEPLLFWLVTAGVLVMILLAMGLWGEVIANARPGTTERPGTSPRAGPGGFRRDEFDALKALVENAERHAAHRLAEVERHLHSMTERATALHAAVQASTASPQIEKVQDDETTRNRQPGT